MVHYYAYGRKGGKRVLVLIEANTTQRAWSVAKRELSDIEDFGELDDLLGWRSVRIIYLGEGV